MRVLVTGGAGFIGSNLCASLVRLGHDVGVIDDLSTGKAENIASSAWFRQLDILDAGLSAAVSEFGPDAVVHLAAQASVAASLADPARDWAVNAEGTAAVARASAECGASRVLSASSAAVYGEPAEVPLSEVSPKSPANPYGRSKLAAESRLADVLAGGVTDFASLRFSNVYGPRQDALGEGGVVALFCYAIASGQTPVIFGTGEQTRDFVFVGDVVDAIVAGLAALGPLAVAAGSAALTGSSASTSATTGAANAAHAADAAYNVSTGLETSVTELAAALRLASGFEGEFAMAPARAGDIRRSALDPAKSRHVFGWQASTPLREGLGETWRWFAGRGDGDARG